MHISRHSIFPALLAAIWSSGCVDYLGFPPGTLYEDDPLDPPGGYFDDLEGLCGSLEAEPNDDPANDEFDTIGTLFSGDQITVCGYADQLTTDGEYWTGDMDYYLFQLVDNSVVHFELDWKTNADMDLVVWDGETGFAAAGLDKPERLDESLTAGYWFLIVTGASGNGDYVTSITVD